MCIENLPRSYGTIQITHAVDYWNRYVTLTAAKSTLLHKPIHAFFKQVINLKGVITQDNLTVEYNSFDF